MFKTTTHLAPEQCLWYCPRGMSLSGTKFQRRFKSRFRPGRTIRRINSKPSQQKVWDRQTKARPFKKNSPIKKKNKKKDFLPLVTSPGQAFLSPMADKLQLSLPRHCRLFVPTTTGVHHGCFNQSLNISIHTTSRWTGVECGPYFQTSLLDISSDWSSWNILQQKVRTWW